MCALLSGSCHNNSKRKVYIVYTSLSWWHIYGYHTWNIHQMKNITSTFHFIYKTYNLGIYIFAWFVHIANISKKDWYMAYTCLGKNSSLFFTSYTCTNLCLFTSHTWLTFISENCTVHVQSLPYLNSHVQDLYMSPSLWKNMCTSHTLWIFLIKHSGLLISILQNWSGIDALILALTILVF